MQMVWVRKGNKIWQEGGRQQYRCKECERQMIEKPKYKRMRGEDLESAIKMRDEGMSYAATGRVPGYAESTIKVHLYDSCGVFVSKSRKDFKDKHRRAVVLCGKEEE